MAPLPRQPLLLAFLLGSTLSIAASGRVSPRLVLDGAVSFAFVPIIEVAAFAVIRRRHDRRMPFAEAVDRFFVTNAPWLLILAMLAAIAAVDTPRETMAWTATPRLWILLAAAIVAAIGSAYLDVQFFRSVGHRSTVAAIADALLFRAIAWPLAAVYFLGYAIWPMLVAWSRS